MHVVATLQGVTKRSPLLCRGVVKRDPLPCKVSGKTQIPRGKPGLPRPGDGVDFHDLTSGDLAAEVVRISDEHPRWLALCGACAKFAQAEQPARQKIIPAVTFSGCAPAL